MHLTRPFRDRRPVATEADRIRQIRRQLRFVALVPRTRMWFRYLGERPLLITTVIAAFGWSGVPTPSAAYQSIADATGESTEP